MCQKQILEFEIKNITYEIVMNSQSNPFQDLFEDNLQHSGQGYQRRIKCRNILCPWIGKLNIISSSQLDVQIQNNCSPNHNKLCVHISKLTLKFIEEAEHLTWWVKH